MNYHHFIVTRFNVNITAVDFPQRLGDAWLSLRFELFQKYCFPTIQGQENQNFTWLVLFDEQTPSRFRPLINAFSRYANFVPVFCGDYRAIMPTVVERMQTMAPEADWFLTTRLDNDDALSIHFVRCLQDVANSLTEAQLQPSDTLFINFPNGLQLHEGDFYDFRDATNAFVSLLERRHDPHTVFWVDHPSINDVAPVIQADTNPLWLQVVHGINVYNHVRGEKVDGTTWKRFFSCNFDE